MRPLFVLCLLLAGCSGHVQGGAKPSEPAAEPYNPVTARTDVPWGPTIYTVEHDGHLFVVARDIGGGGMGLSVLHSPACKCQTKGSK